MNTVHSSFNLKTLFSFLYISVILSVGLSPSVGLAGGDCTGNCLIVIGDPLPSPSPILLPVYGGGDSDGGGLGPPGGGESSTELSLLRIEFASRGACLLDAQLGFNACEEAVGLQAVATGAACALMFLTVVGGIICGAGSAAGGIFVMRRCKDANAYDVDACTRAFP